MNGPQTSLTRVDVQLHGSINQMMMEWCEITSDIDPMVDDIAFVLKLQSSMNVNDAYRHILNETIDYIIII